MNQYRCEYDMIPEKCASIDDDGVCYCSEHQDKCPHFPEHTHHSVKSEREKVLDEVQYKLKQKIQSAPSLHTLILDMKDVDSVFIELRQKAGE